MEFLVLGVEIRCRCSCFQKLEGSSVNYLRCALYNPIISDASDFDILLHMGQFMLCLNKRSTGFKLYIG